MSLRKNISWTFAGNLVYVLCQWGMLAVLAKLGSPKIVGQFALGLAITEPIVLFANLSLRQVQATDALHLYDFRDYLGLRTTTVSFALLIIAAVAFAGYRLETALVILLVGLAKTFEALSDVFYGLLQQRERMDRIAKSMMIKGPLSLVALGLGIYLTGSVIVGTIGLAVAWAAVLLLFDIRSGGWVLSANDPSIVSDSLRPRWEWRTLSRLAYLALPLGLVAALVSLNTNIPRYLIEHYLGEREVGIFAALAYIMVAGNVVVGALGQSATPRLARYYSDGDSRAFRALLLRLAGIGMLLGAMGILIAAIAGRWILALIYTPEYSEYADILVWLMLAAGISYVASLLKFGITAARYFRVQVPLFFCSAGATAISCILLIPRAGILGAAIAAVIGMTFLLAGASGILVYAARALGKNSESRKL